MNTPRKGSITALTTITIAASLLVTAGTLAGRAAAAGVLWVDSARESVNVPLESPALGLTRAKMYLDKGDTERAATALRRIVAKYPTATEAHQLLAAIYRGQGKGELAAMHDKLAQRG